MLLTSLIERLLGNDLSGSLLAIKRRYKGTITTLGSGEIIGMASYSSRPPHILGFTCYCDDPFANGFDMKNYVTIYSRSGFPNLAAAHAFATLEVVRATQKHPDTRFLFYDGVKTEAFLEGRWVRTYLVGSRRECPSCELRNPLELANCFGCGTTLRDVADE